MSRLTAVLHLLKGHLATARQKLVSSINGVKNECMKATAALTREACSETAKECAMAIETSNCDDKKQAVSLPKKIEEAF